MSPTTASGGDHDDRHRELREQLGAYVLGQLTDPQRDALTEHLEHCEPCRLEAERLAPLARSLAGVDPDGLAPAADPGPGAPTPEGFAGTLDRVRTESAADAPSRRDGAAPMDAPTRLVALRSLPARVPAGLEAPSVGTGAEAGPHDPPRPGGDREVRVLAPRRPVASRVLVAAAGVLIALAGLGVGFGIGVGGATTQATGEPVAVQALAPGVSATAGVVAHTWGVEMKLTASGFAPGRAYRVAVLDTAGRAVDAGAFVGTGATEMRCNLNSAVLRPQAAGFVVTDSGGAEVLISRFS